MRQKVQRLSGVPMDTMRMSQVGWALATVLGMALVIDVACAAAVDFQGMGFEKKESDVLESLGVQNSEDIQWLEQEDILNVAGMSVVEKRRLAHKVGALNAISKIRRMDAEGITQEMQKYRLHREVQAEGGKALAKRINQAVKSTTKLEKIGKDDRATDALTRAIDIFDEDGEVVAHAVNAMSMLAMTEESKITIGAEGGLDAVIVAMRTHRKSVDVMLPAMKLLARISFNDKIKKVVATEEMFLVILESVAWHNNETQYADMACLALWQMTTPNEYCLHMAASRGLTDTVMALVNKAGDDVLSVKDSKTGNTCLHAAAMHGQVEVAQFLIGKAGKDLLMAKEREVGWTALHLAAATNQLSMVEMLVAKGGLDLVMVPDTSEGALAFHTAAQRGHLDIVQHLLQVVGPELANLLDNTGNSAVHLAAANGKVETVTWLMTNHMNDSFKAPNKMGYRPADLSELNKVHAVTEAIDKLLGA